MQTMNTIFRFLYPATRYGLATSWLLLLARVAFGLLLMSHGIDKWRHFDALAADFPDPIGWGGRFALGAAIFAEVFCAAGVVAGLFYRLALIPVVFTLGVALLVVHHGDPFAVKELALAYLIVFSLLFMAGPGDFALDRIVGPRFSARRPERELS